MDPLAPRVAARFAADVVQLRPKAVPGPKLDIGGRHYALSTDSGPLMGDLAEELAGQQEGGARLIHTPGANKWRYLWAYDTDNDVVAMWRASDGDEKLWETAKQGASHIHRLDKKLQLNRVTGAEFKRIEAFMHAKAEETIEELKKIVEENKDDAEKVLDQLVREFFDKHVAHHIERAVADVLRGATPIGFKPYDPKGEAVAVQRQAASFVIGRILTKEMSPAHVEAYLRQRKFDLGSIHNQALDWAIGDVRDAAFERFLPPR
jgi:hypothetical protein